MKPLSMAAMLLFVGVVALGLLLLSWRTEYLRNTQLRDGTNAQEVYELYVQGDPIIGSRPFSGDPNAPITIIAVIDFDSAASLEGHNAAMQNGVADLVERGEARLYYKFILTEQEVQKNEGRFIKAAAGLCFQRSDKYFASLIHTLFTSTDADMFLNQNGVNSAACQDETSVLAADAYETAVFRIASPTLLIGIEGEMNTIVYGIPTAARIERAVRNKQIELGI